MASVCINIEWFFFVIFAGLSSATIRNVSLQVDPPSVRRGQHATFICSYDLDGAPLYSVKFYRGNHEFYRYSPSELPTSKVFQFVGFNVDVSIQIFSHFHIKYHFAHFLAFNKRKIQRLPLEYVSFIEKMSSMTVVSIHLSGNV